METMTITREEMMNTAKKFDVWKTTAAEFLCELLDISEDRLIELVAEEGREYIGKYHKKKLELMEESKEMDFRKREEIADDEILTSGTAEEVAGYYISNYDKSAYQQWMDSLMGRKALEKELPCDIFTPRDLDVSRILGEIYGKMTITDIVWDITEFSDGKSGSHRLTEWKIVPKPDDFRLMIMGHDDLEAEIVSYLKDNFGFVPKEFKYMSPMDGLPMHYRKDSTAEPGSFEARIGTLAFPRKEEKCPTLTLDDISGYLKMYVETVRVYQPDGMYKDYVGIENFSKIPVYPGQKVELIHDASETANWCYWGVNFNSSCDNIFDNLIKIGADDSCQFIVPDSASGEAHLEVVQMMLNLNGSTGWVRDVTIEGCKGSTPLTAGGIPKKEEAAKSSDVEIVEKVIPLTADEVECFYNDHAMYVSWNDNTDSMLQDNDYSLEDALRILKTGDGEIFYDGFKPEDDPKYNIKLEEFRKSKYQAWIVGIYGTELNDIKFYRVKGNEKQVKNYLVIAVQTDRNSAEPDDWISGTEVAEDVTVNPDGSLTAYGQYQSYNMIYTAVPMEKAQVLSL